MHLAVIGFTGSFETKEKASKGGGVVKSLILGPALQRLQSAPLAVVTRLPVVHVRARKQIQLGPSPAIDTYIIHRVPIVHATEPLRPFATSAHATILTAALTEYSSFPSPALPITLAHKLVRPASSHTLVTPPNLISIREHSMGNISARVNVSLGRLNYSTK